MDENTEPIIVEQTFNASPETVWKAISDKDQMCKWYFDAIEDFKAEVGFETEFNIHVEGRDFLHQWKVTEAIPRERLVYEWQFAGISGQSSTAWEISATENGSKLRLICEGIETYPQDDPMFTRESGQAGWKYFVQGTLKKYLDG